MHDDDGVVYTGLDTGEICFMDMNSGTEPTGNITREIITPWIGDLITWHTIDAITITSSLNPNHGFFTLDWSQDGFQTVKGTRQITFALVHQQRAIARQLGSARRRQVRLTYNQGAAPFEFDEFFADVTAGD
jgi:hypothetical protein